MRAPGGGADPWVPELRRVGRTRRETHDTWTLELEGAGGGAPGQFNMLYVFAVGEVPISISGDTADPSRLVHTVRAVGPVSGAITQLRRGDAVGVRGPFGTGWPVQQAAGRDIVLVAGGLGLAPLRPAVYAVLAARERYGKVVLLYGTRSPNDILYRDEIGEWRRRLDAEVEVTVDHAPSPWRGNVGVVTDLIPRASFDPHDTVAMICGPEVMMRFTVAALRDAGVTPDRIHLSMERNMKCAIGQCGHCQLATEFICRDGPVLRFDRIEHLFGLREI